MADGSIAWRLDLEDRGVRYILYVPSISVVPFFIPVARIEFGKARLMGWRRLRTVMDRRQSRLGGRDTCPGGCGIADDLTCGCVFLGRDIDGATGDGLIRRQAGCIRSAVDRARETLIFDDELRRTQSRRPRVHNEVSKSNALSRCAENVRVGCYCQR